jgi:hypothetical protein
MSTIAQNETATRPGLFTREKLTAVGHIALWSSLARFFIANGGLITLLVLTHGSGIHSAQDIIGIVSGSLISFIVLSTRTRWAPLVSTLVTGYVFFLTSRDQYELFDLANPKGPNGGFPVFFMDVIVMALAILAFTGSLGATIEKYRALPRWIVPLGLSLVIGLVIGATYIGALR